MSSARISADPIEFFQRSLQESGVVEFCVANHTRHWRTEPIVLILYP